MRIHLYSLVIPAQAGIHAAPCLLPLSDLGASGSEKRRHQTELTNESPLRLAVGATFWGISERTHLDVNRWSGILLTTLKYLQK